MKYKIKRRRKTIKTKYIFIAFVVALICISISYARHSSTLIINGTAIGEQEQFDVTYLYFADSSDYPATAGYMSTYTYTFEGSPTIESIIMGEKTLVLNTDYTYSNGTLTIPNVTGNIVIESENNGEDVWVTYVYGTEKFGGTKVLNTGIPLFSTENVNRDFEISIDVSNFTPLSGQDTNRNVILCNQNESGEPYQGFAFQYRDKAIKIQVNGTKVPDVQKPWGKTSGRIVFTRTNNVLYQDGNLLYDFANIIIPFNAHLSLGANLDVSGKPRRYSKVDLSNITIKMKYTYNEYLNLCQNFPTPDKTSSMFDGWYSSAEGGTQIMTTNQLDANGRILYAHWQNAANVHVTFDANGGTGTMGRQVVPNSESTRLNSNAYTRDGYSFVGWSSTPDGMGDRYSDREFITIKEDLILYAQWLRNPITEYTADSLTFNGSIDSIVDTGMYLFSNENIHKNFEIYFEVDSINANNSKQATIMNTKDETGTPYPGIVCRIDTNLVLKADSTATNSKRVDKKVEEFYKLRVIRINDITYYSINDADYAQLMDFSNIVRTFNAPVALGGVVKPDGARLRAFRGTLSNIVVRFIDDDATLEDYQNAVSNPGE